MSFLFNFTSIHWELAIYYLGKNPSNSKHVHLLWLLTLATCHATKRSSEQEKKRTKKALCLQVLDKLSWFGRSRFLERSMAVLTIVCDFEHRGIVNRSHHYPSGITTALCHALVIAPAASTYTRVIKGIN